MEDFRIKITSDDSSLDDTSKKIRDIGKASDETTSKFEKNAKVEDDINAKRKKALLSEIENLEALKRAKERAFSPENILGFEKSIKESQARINALNTELGKSSGAMNIVTESANKFGQSVGTAYGWIRKAAYIIPGLGIGSLIMLGWEALSSLLGDITEGLDKGKKLIAEWGVENKIVNDNLSDQKKLWEEINKSIIENNFLKGKISKEERNKYLENLSQEKRLEDIESDKLNQIKEKIKIYKIGAEEFEKIFIKYNQFGEVEKKTNLFTEALKNVGKLTDVQIAELKRYVLELEDTDELGVKEFWKFQGELTKIEKNAETERTLARTLNKKVVSNIEQAAENEAEKERKKAAAKKKREDDAAWRLYLRNWENNFNELLRLYKKDSDDFIKENQHKFDEAKRKSDENVKLIIDNMKLEASLSETKIDDENARYQEELNNFQIQFDEQGKITEASYKHLELLKEIHEKNLTDIQKKEKEKRIKEATDELKQIALITVKYYEQLSQVNLDYIDHREQANQNSIENNKTLAKEGLRNELAFAEQRQNQLEKQRLQELRRQKKEKELETFLNSVASFSKTDPKTAVVKALGVLATERIAEIAFMEKGGIAGDIGQRKMIGGSASNGILFGNSHSSGGILTELEHGEGVLSKNEMASLGRQGFYNLKTMLQKPMIEKPVNNSVFIGMENVVSEIKALQTIVKRKSEVNVDWDSMGNMIVTSVENGVKTATKNMQRRPRI